MMRVLVVDDQPEKVEDILRLLANCGVERHDVTVCSNAIKARNEIAKVYFDILILDINIPTQEFGEPNMRGGLDLIYEIGRVDYMKQPGTIIGLTAYVDLQLEAAPEFMREGMWSVIHYSESSEDWKEPLENKVRLVTRDLEMRGQPADYEFDLAVVTALADPERKQVLALLEDAVEVVRPDDGTVYTTGRFSRTGKELSVVVASASQMGMVPAATLTLKIAHHFKPRYVCMTGIAAGVEGKCNYGDVLIPSTSWDYGSGKITVDKEGSPLFLPEPNMLPLCSELKDKLNHAASQRLYVADIARRWRPHGEALPLQARLAPVASGASVIEVKDVVQQAVDVHRKVIGIEMEVFGVFYAAEHCLSPRPKAFALKSVCDFADLKKDDSHQEYAAFTSAQYLWHFSLDYL